MSKGLVSNDLDLACVLDGYEPRLGGKFQLMGEEFTSESAMLWARVAAFHDSLEDMVWQFGHRSHNAERKWICTGGLSALEHAFDILGWPDPRYVEDGDCAFDGCHAWPSCGLPTEDGYKQLCGEHYQVLSKAQTR